MTQPKKLICEKRGTCTIYPPESPYAKQYGGRCSGRYDNHPPTCPGDVAIWRAGYVIRGPIPLFEVTGSGTTKAAALAAARAALAKDGG